MSIERIVDPRHWRFARRLFQRSREFFFTKQPSDTQLLVDADIDKLRRSLGRSHFTNSWELSYNYEGEDMNMRRPEYVEDGYGWYQLHLRGYDRPGGVAVSVHFELEPTAYPGKHLDLVNVSIEEGVERLTPILDELGYEYELKR